VNFYNTDKGFGFIRDLKTQDKIFFHVNGLIDAVKENDKVTFETEKGLKGMNAVNVKLQRLHQKLRRIHFSGTKR